MAQVPHTGVSHVGDGVTTIFDFDFPYQQQSEVFVNVDGVNTPFTWLAGSTHSVQLAAPAALDAAIDIYRSTSAFSPRHLFDQGVPFLPRYVDENNNQLLYAVQEAINSTAGDAAEALVVAEEARDIANDVSGRLDVALIDSATALRADLADPAKGVALVAGSTVAVEDYAALRALPASALADTYIVRNAFDFGDKGGGVYKRITTTSVEAVPFLIAGVGGKYALVLNSAVSAAAFGVRVGADPAASIQKFVDRGDGRYVIPSGYYTTTGTIYEDHSALDFPEFFRANNRRVVLAGESTMNTIVNFQPTTQTQPFFHLEAGKLGPAQGGGSFVNIEKMQVVRDGNGYHDVSARQGVAFKLTNLAFATLRDLRATFMDTGFDFTGVLTSEMTNLHANWCKVGFRYTGSALSLCNALNLSGLRAAGCSELGMLFNGGGSGVGLQGGTVEQCGTSSINNEHGGIRVIFNPANGSTGMRVHNVYFEGNAGGADFFFDNPTASPVTLYIGGCTFHRMEKNKFTQFNIFVGNSGGGGVKVHLDGNTHNSYGDYEPTFTRPFVGGDTGVEFFGWDTCNYGETASASQGLVSAGSTLAGHIDRTGAHVTPGPRGLTCVRQAAGVYVFTRDVKLGSFLGGFKVTANVNDLNNTTINYIRNASDRSFMIVTCPIGGGAPVDAELTYTITTTS